MTNLKFYLSLDLCALCVQSTVLKSWNNKFLFIYAEKN